MSEALLVVVDEDVVLEEPRVEERNPAPTPRRGLDPARERARSTHLHVLLVRGDEHRDLLADDDEHMRRGERRGEPVGDDPTVVSTRVRSARESLVRQHRDEAARRCRRDPAREVLCLALGVELERVRQDQPITYFGVLSQGMAKPADASENSAPCSQLEPVFM